MICSPKAFTKIHKMRHKIALMALKTGKVDVFGGILDGQMFPYKSTTLKDYRFQIVVENDITPYYWTEKIMDCFASCTIPLYIGATKIGKFFNPDGIIDATCLLQNIDTLENLLKQCSAEVYEERLEAVLDNYQRCLKYLNIDDIMYETLFKDKIQ